MTTVINGSSPSITFSDSTTQTTAFTTTPTINTITSATATALTLQSAGTTAMTVDTSQNVGIGGSPVGGARLTVIGSGVLSQFTGNNANNYIQISDNNGLANMSIGSIGGGNAYMFSSGYTALYAGSAERMRIDSSGNLLVGTTDSSYMGKGIKVTGNTSTGTDYTILFGFANNVESFGLRNDGYMRCTAVYNKTTASSANVVVDGSQFLIRSTSALKYKQDIRDLPFIDINKFRPVIYKSKCEGDDQAKDHFGIIADEVDAAGIKELVQYGAEGEIEGFSYDRLTAVLVKAIQEQQAMIEELKTKVTALESK